MRNNLEMHTFQLYLECVTSLLKSDPQCPLLDVLRWCNHYNSMYVVHWCCRQFIPDNLSNMSCTILCIFTYNSLESLQNLLDSKSI